MTAKRATTALLLLAAVCPLALSNAQPILRLKSGRIPPNLLMAEGPAELGGRAVEVKRADAARRHFLLQFQTNDSNYPLDALGERDVRVLEYMPDDGLVVSAPDGVDLKDLGVVYAGQLEAGDKVSAEFGAAEAAEAVMEVHLDVGVEVARRIAVEEGLEVLENPDLKANAIVVRGPVAALWAAAEWDEVAYIYPASEELVKGVPVVACTGGAVGVGELGGAANLASSFGEGWDGAGLGSATLAYWIGTLPSWLDASAGQGEIVRAMQAWGGVVAVKFESSSVRRLRRQIEIFAAAKEHGDGFAFDGKGGVLAHTFYPPPNAETLAGDLHLDMDEPWKIGADVDLYSVVLHEMGHALGLGHNDNPASVMYPYYRKVSGLNELDVAEIRKLYAAASTPTTPTTPTTPVTPTTPTTPSNPTTPTAPTTPVTPTNPGNSADVTAPAMKITYPSATSVSTTATAITVRGSATDAGGVADVSWATKNAGGAAGAPYSSFTAGPIQLVKGLNQIKVTATDKAGNTAWRMVYVTRR